MEAQERNTRLDQYKPGRAPPISSPKLRDMLREVKITNRILSNFAYSLCFVRRNAGSASESPVPMCLRWIATLRMIKYVENVWIEKSFIKNLTFVLQSLALGFLKSEISELEADIEKQEAIVAEIMEEADQWLYEQMEAVEMMQIESLEQNSGIFCPVCRKSVLTQTTDSIIGCACGLK